MREVRKNGRGERGWMGRREEEKSKRGARKGTDIKRQFSGGAAENGAALLIHEVGLVEALQLGVD